MKRITMPLLGACMFLFLSGCGTESPGTGGDGGSAGGSSGGSGGSGAGGGGGGSSGGKIARIEIERTVPCNISTIERHNTPHLIKGRPTTFQAVGFDASDKKVTMSAFTVTWNMTPPDLVAMPTKTGTTVELTGMRDFVDLVDTKAPQATVRACVEDLCKEVTLDVEHDFAAGVIWKRVPSGAWFDAKHRGDCRMVDGFEANTFFVYGSSLEVDFTKTGTVLEGGTKIEFPDGSVFRSMKL